MAISPASSEPKAQDGPRIGDMPSKVQTFTAQQLRGSPFLPGLVKTINLAYLTAEKSGLGGSTGDRLSSVDELISVLRDDPESFIITLTQPHAPEEVLSTATVRRYYGPSPEASTLPWACTHKPDDDTEEWEIKLLATHPAAQGKGVASYILGLAELEVITRFKAKAASHTRSEAARNDQPRKAKMILCTPKPLYGQYYAKRGYCEDYIRVREKPDLKFEITFMSKALVI